MADESADGGALTGQTLGDYRLIERLREGATADLYRGEDGQLGRAVAVKVLRDGADAPAVARFAEAARRMASLDHGNVVRVLASGKVDGRHYLAMPLLKESLRERLAREGIPPVGEAARIVVQAAAGLNAAHTHGFAHGNVSPDTIMFDEAGRVALIDFAAPAVGGARSGAAPGGEEQAAGPAPAAEIAEDIYALGAVLYELLTGEQPVWRIGVDDASSGLTPPSALNPLVWSALDAVVLRAMAADPAARFADTRLFAQALRATVLVHMHAERISGEMETVKASAVRAPRAAFDAPGAILPSADEAAALRGARRGDRRVLAAALALTLVFALACAGSAFAVMGGFHFPGGGSGSQGPGSGPGVTTTLPIGQIAIVTATATDTPTPTPTPLATDTPIPTATPASEPTATPVPGGRLTFDPTQVTFVHNASLCAGQQTIHNTGQSDLTWSWTGGTLPPNFFWSVAGSPPAAGRPKGISIGGGQSDTLSMWASCSHQKYPIAVRDSQGFSYSIALVVP